MPDDGQKPHLFPPLKAVEKLAANPAINGTEFHPSDDQRLLVQVLAAAGNSQRLISIVIGCSVPTLRKAFRAQLKQTKDIVDAMVGAAVVRSALQGNVAAQKYYLLTHGVPGWQIPKTGDAAADAAIAAALSGSNGEEQSLAPRIYIPETEPEPEEEMGPVIDGDVAEAA